MADLTAEDLALEALADDRVALEEEALRYRELALAAIEQLADLQRQIATWQAKHQALVDEIRRYTRAKM